MKRRNELPSLRCRNAGYITRREGSPDAQARAPKMNAACRTQMTARQHHCLVSSSIPQPAKDSAHQPPEMRNTDRSKTGGGGWAMRLTCGLDGTRNHSSARATPTPPPLLLSRLRRSPPPPLAAPSGLPVLFFSRRWGSSLSPRTFSGKLPVARGEPRENS